MKLSKDNLTSFAWLRRYYRQLEPTIKKPQIGAATSAVFSFLAVSLFVWYAIRPTAQTIIYLRREIADKTLLNQKMEDKISALIEAQASYEEMYDRLTLLDQALPPNPDPVLLARQLRNLALVSQASVSAIQVASLPLIIQKETPEAKLTPSKPRGAFPVSVVLSGEYPTIKAFLQRLLTLRRIVTIESLNIRHESEEGGSSLQLLVRLNGHYLLQ